MADDIKLPEYVNGKWIVYKDPDDKDFYHFDLTDDLALRATTALAAEAIVAGVTVLEGPVLQANGFVIKLDGLDVSDEPVNFCTLRITLANTAQIDKTMWFKRKDN